MNLQELCLSKISQSIINAPPAIQELILNTSKKDLEKKVKKDIILDTTKGMSFLIDKIFEQILENRFTKKDEMLYYSIYNYIDKDIIHEAIETAKTLHEKILNLSNSNISRFYNTLITPVGISQPMSENDSDYEYDSNRFEDDGESEDGIEDDDRSFTSMNS
jgi:hypothetical protein